MNNRFLHAIAEQKRRTEQYNPLVAGTLGITLNGVATVQCPDRPSFVYVQVRSSQAEIIQAFNDQVSPVYGLPVFIQWQGNRYVVTGRDTMRYSNWQDSSAYLPMHHSTHEFRGSAGDVVFVAPEQFLPLMPQPSGSLGAKSIIINDYNAMLTTGSFTYFPQTATQDLTAWNPSTTGAVMVLVMMDALNGNLTYSIGSGSIFGNWLTGTTDVLPHVPVVPDISRYLPIVAVRLVSSTQTISWDNLYDVRPWMGVYRGTVGGGGGGGGTPAGTGTFLAIDASNGPLRGPLVVYQGFPNQFNQYFDYSTIVGYLSGTSNVHFGAGVEAVNWSTGTSSYGMYVDDEGSNLGLFVGGAGKMDNVLVSIDQNMNNFRNGGRFFSPTMRIRRFGGGAANRVIIASPAIQIMEQDVNNSNPPSIEIDANSQPRTYLWPMNTGTYMHPILGDWFPNQAPYFFDTWSQIPTGAPLFVVLNNTSAKFWIDPSGMVVSRGGFNTEYGTYDIAGRPHTHVITGVAFNGPFPQPVFGFYGEKNGVPLGSGSTLNIRGQNFDFTLSGTTFDLFLTGTAGGGGGGGGGVDQIGVYGFNQGLALGTGTSINFRGPSVNTTLSGTVLDVFFTGTVGAQGPTGPAGAFGIYAEDEGVPLGTGTIINFRGDPITATISGTAVDVFVTGSSPWYQSVYESGTSFADFTAAGGTWLSSGSIIRQTDTAAVQRRAKYNNLIPTFTVIWEAEINIQTAGSVRRGGLIVGFDGSSANGAIVYIDGNGTIDMETDASTLRLSVSTTVNTNTWYKIRMVASGGIVTFYKDGVIMGSAISLNISNVSYVGLYTYQAEVWFRNIKAWNLTLPV